MNQKYHYRSQSLPLPTGKPASVFPRGIHKPFLQPLQCASRCPTARAPRAPRRGHLCRHGSLFLWDRCSQGSYSTRRQLTPIGDGHCTAMPRRAGPARHCSSLPHFTIVAYNELCTVHCCLIKRRSTYKGLIPHVILAALQANTSPSCTQSHSVLHETEKKNNSPLSPSAMTQVAGLPQR